MRMIHMRTEMPILAFSSLLCENKKNPVIDDTPSGIEPGPLNLGPTCSLLH